MSYEVRTEPFKISYGTICDLVAAHLYATQKGKLSDKDHMVEMWFGTPYHFDLHSKTGDAIVDVTVQVKREQEVKLITDSG